MTKYMEVVGPLKSFGIVSFVIIKNNEKYISRSDLSHITAKVTSYLKIFMIK